MKLALLFALMVAVTAFSITKQTRFEKGDCFIIPNQSCKIIGGSGIKYIFICQETDVMWVGEEYIAKIDANATAITCPNILEEQNASEIP